MFGSIEGLEIIELTVHGDNRGWFKENWHAGRGPRLFPVQNNISFNAQVGTTRGLHAEPWDKYVSVATGEVFGAWCDLREGSPTYGNVATARITPAQAVFVPRGVANGFQALQENTAYTYLVNDHWSANAQYSFVNLASVGIEWPIPLEQAELSEKDKHHPPLALATPVPARPVLVVGANGQVGRALAAQFPGADLRDSSLDITDLAALEALNWRGYRAVINAAAFTAVDAAEQEGRAKAWAVNATGAANVARLAQRHHIPVVHFSSDYVFDGQRQWHTEDEPFSPINTYGAAKAAGDAAVMATDQHYILRTSWVVGDGPNFVRTMVALRERGVVPKVVDDQFGRLSFATELAAAAAHLMNTGAPYGTYNATASGDVVSWVEVAKEILPAQRCTTAEFGAVAPRPTHSALALDKLQATGFFPRDWRVQLAEYLAEYLTEHQGGI
ncbi:bifunctional dTDP-4-dehydrorhamnose 3,5-epimerase family protein/NAD(P)-dependent oxidoreductase [Corynebacterium sp. 35RC1]|nr:bifunctional dTDP-4-dehydrorhamnose 3,5-epimerase family protein/NAD(P)-dependent oxidoreductase [Corynebacterium sp. 35RC1]